MDEKEMKYCSIRERFNAIASVQKKAELIHDLRLEYGSDMTLAELEEQLWLEKENIKEGTKKELFI